jgi:hypothetical protein
MDYHPHTEFHYSKLLTYLAFEYGNFMNISGTDLNESGYGQVLKCMLISGWLFGSLHYCSGLDGIME